MAKLRIKDEHGKERVHELVDSVTTIGRASTNTIQVSDEKASRNHFRVEKSDGKYKVVDLGSTNGTRLNGSKISADTILKPKDTIQLGKTTFVFEDPEAVPEKMGDAFPAISGGETVEMDPIKLKEEDAQKPTATAEQAGPKFVLKVLEGKNPGKVYELGVQALTIGRHNSSTIQIIDDAASNYHAEINREPIGYVLTDLGSTNGTRVRQKNKSEFEKVVKTPLSVGMQIRVGKTLLEFENIGKPVEDEALFGTIALDPDKLEDKLVRPQKNNAALILLGLAMVLVFGIVVAAVIYFATPPSDKPPKIVDNRPPPNLENLIKNAEFDDGTDDDGNPKYFKVQRGAPGVKVSVVPDADRAGDAENKQKLGLQISKAGARSASARTIVETADSFGVEAGKSYEFSGWLRNDGDGLYGLHVTWIQGDRELEEGHIVLKEQQEWKEKTIVLTPPSWATRARAGVFAIGKDGKTFFDSLSFKEKPDASATAHPNVKFGGVAVNFEGTKGAFTAESQGETVLTGGSLVLVTQDNKAESELYSALKPEVKHDSSKVSYTGEMYDFALQEATNYSVQAQPGAAGVDLRVAMDAAQDNGSIPQLRFYIVGPTASGDVELTKADGKTERIASGEQKHLTGLKGVLFNAGRTPQLDLAFEKPADVEIKPEGARRRVTIKFKGELKVALAPESVGQKQKMMAVLGDLNRTLDASRFGEAEGKIKALRDEFASKFAQAKDESDRAQERVEKEWKNTREEIDRAIKPLETAVTPAGVQTARDTVQRYVANWAGSSRADLLKADLQRIDGLEKSGEAAAAEAGAETYLKKAENYNKPGSYNVTVSMLKKMLNDPVQSKTKAAERAKALLPNVEAAMQREEDLRRITDKLLEKIKAFELGKDYKSAIDLIEKDKEYQANKNDLTEIENRLRDLRRKMQ